ncbi:glycosyltransferase family 4 protein [Fimbriimonas ginsengisoli]|uniref:Putative glycosyl transferase, family 1 n=1 Tax=Fimbriimonas ginsengisoli Gsoil 348 TaxID=661478 RepID=A0A068NUK9_FIMGI|nr:glycosyltransferase family 4 protein [Fimbriimonas ginsengisoli]AIE87032.1 putative glycosyl transferase, family 1 [Fimbriimonas ginsengisoli Gsoil 348]
MGGQPLSVAHYHPCLTGSGGDRVSESELRYLAAHGHHTSFLVAYDPCGYEDSVGAPWRAFHGHDLSPREARRSAEVVIPESVAFLREHRADLLHCHNITILPQALLLTRALDIPLFFTAHTWGERWTKWRWSYKPKRRLQFRMIREAIAESKGFFAVSPAVGEHMKQIFGGAASHVQYLPNPIHDAFFLPAESGGRDIDVAVVGRPVPMKNPKLIAEALARLRQTRPNARFAWIGATGEEEALGAVSPSAGIEFLGVKSPEEVSTLLRRSKVLLHASLREGFGLSVAEAALCGCRLVLSDIPALRSGFGVPGAWFFPVDDSRRAATSLESALVEGAAVPGASGLGLVDGEGHGERLLSAYRGVVASACSR